MKIKTGNFHHTHCGIIIKVTHNNLLLKINQLINQVLVPVLIWSPIQPYKDNLKLPVIDIQQQVFQNLILTTALYLKSYLVQQKRWVRRK